MPPEPVPDFPLRWLYIDFNSFFASVEQQLQPQLRGKPVMVLPVMSDFTSAIAASYEAKAYGIKTGTMVRDARRICPEIQCVLGRHEHYVEVHKRILEVVEKELPISQVCSIDEVACQLMRNEQSEAAVQEIAARIKAVLAQKIGKYITCSIGVAPNKYLAKIATDLKKPNGFTILRAANLPQRLLPLALRDLPGIGHQMEDRLHAAGIYSVEQLWNLAPKQMRALWHSVWGEKLWYMLRGHEVPDVETTRSSVGHSHVLAPELRPVAEAYFVAKRLAMKAASRLRRMQYDATRLFLGLRTEDGRRIGLEVPFAAASDTMTILKAMDEAWAAAMRNARPARLKKVSITLYGLAAQNENQLALWSELGRAEKFDRLAGAMDKINQRYGRDTILQGMLPGQGKAFSGTKIAFTRIPDMQEFQE